MSITHQRPFAPQGNDVVSSYLSTVANNLNRNNLQAGHNITIAHGVNGKIIHADAPSIPDSVQFMGTFDITKDYYPNQMVIVPAAGSYNDHSGNPIPYSTDVSNPYTGAFIAAGTYICKTYVPSFNASSTMFLSTVAPAYASSGVAPNDETANAYRWYADVIAYYPTTNSIASIDSNTNTISDSGFNINTGIQYWVQVGAGGSGTGGWDYKGEFDITIPYAKNNVLSLSDGSSDAALYLVTATIVSGSRPTATNGNYFLIVYAPRAIPDCNGATVLVHTSGLLSGD